MIINKTETVIKIKIKYNSLLEVYLLVLESINSI